MSMINVSSWSIRNPIPAILLFVLLTLIGVMGFRGMKIQQFPDIDLPTVTVTAALPGASPAQMETDVARKLEDSIATLQGVKHIYTLVQQGSVTITVEFRLEVPTQEAVDGVRDAVSRIRSSLPGDLRDPVVSKVNLAGSPILTYTVASGRMDDEALSWFVDNTVAKRLLSVRGVGAVARVGGVDREVRVELDPARMLALGATAADVSRQLRQTQQEASGGRADVGGVEQSVRTIGTVQSAAELARMDIVLSDGRRVRLDRSPAWPTRSPSSARRRCSTASRWSASRSRAAAAPGSSRSPTACVRNSTSSRPSIPTSRSSSLSTSSNRWRRTTRARCGC